MQLQNAECRTQPKMFTLYVQHAECRMQDAESAPKWILLHGAGCRMQNAGCKIRPKEFVRRVQLTALSPIPHPASASCILHRVLRHPALGPILHSAFCICILHRVPKVQHIQVRSGHQDLICAPFSHGQVCGYDSSPKLTRCSLGPAGGCSVGPPGRVAPLALLRR